MLGDQERHRVLAPVQPLKKGDRKQTERAVERDDQRGPIHTGSARRRRDHWMSHDIARELTVSLNTVRSHIRSIDQKLDASTKTEAVMAVLRRGLLTG